MLVRFRLTFEVLLSALYREHFFLCAIPSAFRIGVFRTFAAHSAQSCAIAVHSCLSYLCRLSHRGILSYSELFSAHSAKGSL